MLFLLPPSTTASLTLPLRNLIAIGLTAIISLACYLKAVRNHFVVELADAMYLVKEKYVEEIDERELFENAMDGMVNHLDQHSNYIRPEKYGEFQESIDQEFGGIGIHVGQAEQGEYLKVLRPVLDSPAHKAGVKAGDAIVSIDGENTLGMTLEVAVDKIKGPLGETVKLELRHKDEERTVTIEVERAIVQTESVLGDVLKDDLHWDFRLQNDQRIAYIRLKTFGQRSAAEMRKALTSPDLNAKAVILDLRRNAGGLLGSAVEICDLFVNKGKVVSIRRRGGEIRDQYTAKAKTMIPLSIPMVVLIDGGSASASEIVAACLQDHKRATVIGERSYGKGTVQEIIELEGGSSALKLTTASYWRPSDANIHRRRNAKPEDEWGVRPNKGFEVELTDKQWETVWNERADRDAPDAAFPEPIDSMADVQLKKAIEFLQQKLGD